MLKLFTTKNYYLFFLLPFLSLFISCNKDKVETLECPLFNEYKVNWAEEELTVTDEFFSCSVVQNERWTINMGNNEAFQVKVVFAKRPQAAKNYTIIIGNDNLNPAVDECYIQIKKDGETVWNSIGGEQALSCTRVENDRHITRVKWDLIRLQKVSENTIVESSGKMMCR